MIIDADNIPLDCAETWNLIRSGNTLGCFQLETSLGQSMAKKCQPRNINELSALIAIIRPGASEAMINNKSITKRYVDRKSGKEPVDYFHSELEDILGDTFGLNVFQEQSLKIAQKIAGFNEEDADSLRSAIGKKLVKKMAEMKIKFLAGAKKLGIVTDEEAKEIFGWIEKSQRYSFNRSHSVSYSRLAYATAYFKTHYPKEFFVTYLGFAKDKNVKPLEEVRNLVNNAKMMNVDVKKPDLTIRNSNFELIDGTIYFGLLDIKNVGSKVLEKLSEEIKSIEINLGKQLKEWSWTELLIYLSQHINKTSITNMIKVGALDHFEMNRSLMLYQYLDIWINLTDREKAWIQNYYHEPQYEYKLSDLLQQLLDSDTGQAGGIATKKRRSVINDLYALCEKPSTILIDDPDDIATYEQSLLGISLTYHKTDRADRFANCTCKEFYQGKSGYIAINGQVDAVNEYFIKKGKNKNRTMAFLILSDKTGSINSVVVFPDLWESSQDFVQENSMIFVAGERRENSLISQKILQI